MRCCFLLSTLLFCGAASAQSLQGRITDAETGASLPYATLLLLHEKTIVTADSGGRFHLAPRDRSDTLHVSCVGYASARFALSATSDSMHLALVQRSRILRPVLVGDFRRRAEIPHFSGGTISSRSSSGSQTQMGQHLQAPVAGSLLHSVTVGTSVSLFQQYRYRFRLRVYDWDSVAQRPGEELTDSDIQVRGATHNISIRLDSFGILLPHRDFVVAVEWLWLPENAFRFKDERQTIYHPSIRMKSDAPDALEAWSFYIGWLGRSGWVNEQPYRGHKTSVAISAVVDY